MTLFQILVYPSANGSQYLIASAEIVFIVHIIAAFIQCRHERSNVINCVSGPSILIAASFTFTIRGLFIVRHLIATCLYCAWGLHLTKQRFQNDEVQNIKHVFSKSVFITLCAAPVIALNTLETHHKGARFPTHVYDIIFVMTALLGLACHVKADNTQTITINSYALKMDGVWTYSRHIDAFGLFLFHLSLYGLVFEHTPSWSCIGVIFNCVLFFGFKGGFVYIEKERNEKLWNSKVYLEYREQTCPFFPLPIGIYQHVPICLKKHLLLEWDLIRI